MQQRKVPNRTGGEGSAPAAEDTKRSRVPFHAAQEAFIEAVKSRYQKERCYCFYPDVPSMMPNPTAQHFKVKPVLVIDPSRQLGWSNAVPEVKCFSCGEAHTSRHGWGQRTIYDDRDWTIILYSVHLCNNPACSTKSFNLADKRYHQTLPLFIQLELDFALSRKSGFCISRVLDLLDRNIPETPQAFEDFHKMLHERYHDRFWEQAAKYCSYTEVMLSNGISQQPLEDFGVFDDLEWRGVVPSASYLEDTYVARQESERRDRNDCRMQMIEAVIASGDHSHKLPKHLNDEFPMCGLYQMRDCFQRCVFYRFVQSKSFAEVLKFHKDYVTLRIEPRSGEELQVMFTDSPKQEERDLQSTYRKLKGAVRNGVGVAVVCAMH